MTYEGNDTWTYYLESGDKIELTSNDIKDIAKYSPTQVEILLDGDNLKELEEVVNTKDEDYVYWECEDQYGKIVEIIFKNNKEK